jgi:hypothetical protein
MPLFVSINSVLVWAGGIGERNTVVAKVPGTALEGQSRHKIELYAPYARPSEGDSRLLGVRVFTLSLSTPSAHDEPLTPATPIGDPYCCKWGEVLEFDRNSALSYATTGWSAPSPSGVWSLGSLSEIRFRAEPTTEAGRLRLQVGGGGEIAVEINEAQVFQGSIPETVGIVPIDIPRGILDQLDHCVTIRRLASGHDRPGQYFEGKLLAIGCCLKSLSIDLIYGDVAQAHAPEQRPANDSQNLLGTVQSPPIRSSQKGAQAMHRKKSTVN